MTTRIVGVTLVPTLDPEGPWQADTAYTKGQILSNDSRAYICHVGHTSAAETEPGEGEDWETVWTQLAADGATGATGATGPAGPAGTLDATGITAGHVPTADGSDDWAWGAPSGGGGWTGLTSPASAVAVSDTSAELATLAFAGANLTQNAVFSYRASMVVTANPSTRQISALLVQLADSETIAADFFRVGNFETVNPASVGTVLEISGTFQVKAAGDPGSIVSAFTPSRHSTTADGVRKTFTADSASQFVDCDTAAITRLRIVGVANSGSDLEMQVMDFAYRIDTAEAP
jgi:hypothetical protein